MSTSVLPQLLEVDSRLMAQETSLEAQLVALQKKRKGIQTVIAMFESGDAPLEANILTGSEAESKAAESKITESKAAEPKAAEPKATEAKATEAKVTEAKASKAKAPKAKTPKTKAPKNKVDEPSTKTKTRKVKASQSHSNKSQPNKVDSATKETTAKRGGRTANWQKYIQDAYSEVALPDVIVGVLKSKPNNIFKIADVMNTVFKEDMPKTHFLKARNRVSNILSAGARDGEWYRGRGGTYSASEKAIKTVG